MFNHAKVPLSEETLQGFGQVWTHCPRCPEGRGPWGWFPFPPDNGVVNGLEGEGAVSLLDIRRQTAQSVA